MTEEPTGEKKLEAIRDRYIEIMAPLFFPKDPIGHDIIRYFASLLRVVGMEDKGWDPTLNRVQSWKIEPVTMGDPERPLK
jgi:hypothetical protein